MRKYWYRRILIMIATFTVAVGGSYYLIRDFKEQMKQEVSADTAGTQMVIPGGMPIGIYLETEGVMVLGTEAIDGIDGMPHEPAENLVTPGDYIIAMDGEEIRDKSRLVEAVENLRTRR